MKKNKIFKNQTLETAQATLKMRKNKTKLLIITTIILTLFSIPIINAEETIKTISIPLNPYYKAGFTNGIPSTYTLNVTSPDGIKKINSAFLKFQTFISPTLTMTLNVNGQNCNPTTHTISTTYAGASQTIISYDCTNIINKEGTYNISITTNKNTGSSVSYLELTYTNDPLAQIQVHGTEYSFGQTSKAWLQLLNSSDPSQTIDEALCFIDIYYPNMTQLINEAQMLNFNSQGIYYYDIILPEIEGVYPVVAHCYYVAQEIPNNMTSFDLINGTNPSGTITDTNDEDGVFLRLKEANYGGTRRIQADFNITAPLCNNVSEMFMKGINIHFNSKFGSATNDNLNFEIRNHTSNTWLPLNNFRIPSNLFLDTSNTIFTSNLTKAGLTKSDGTGLSIKVIDTAITDGADTNLDIDYMAVHCQELVSSTYEELKGSSEMHLNANLNTSFNDQFQQWLNQSSSQYNNITNILNNLTNITTDNQNWLQNIWNYLNTLITNYLTEINTTTNQNQDLIYLLLNQTNTTQIPSTITYLTENCITGSDWIITSKVYDQNNNLLDNTTTTCSIYTSIDNQTNNMTYETPDFIHRQTCPITSTWNWSITCV